MSFGSVRELGDQLFAICPIYVNDPTGLGRVYHAYIDTGFTGFLALPAIMREESRLEFVGSITANFGNAAVERVDTYLATVYWDGNWREITVVETGDHPLIGMNLLRGSRVCFDAADRGEIQIRRSDASS